MIVKYIVSGAAISCKIQDRLTKKHNAALKNFKQL